MADAQHIAILGRGVIAWNEWRQQLRERKDSVLPDLREASLRMANLEGVDFAGAILSGADLQKTNLSKADLHGADLTGGNLADSDLTASNLSGVDLSETLVVGANFQRARVGWTRFGNVDLSEARGLDEVLHEAPSTIGIDTFLKSKGRIPEGFLRGTGVPDAFILYSNSLIGRPLQFYSCFISYSHADKLFARRLHDALQSGGIRCWLDDKQLRAGDDIYEQIERGIRLWDKVLLCCSQHSLTSSWVAQEIGVVLEKERQLTRERKHKVQCLIPLNLDGYLFSGKWKSPTATQLLSRLAADFTAWEHDSAKFQEQTANVARALRADEQEEAVVPTSLQSTPLSLFAEHFAEEVHHWEAERRYQELIERKYVAGLSPEEAEELSGLWQQLSDLDVPFYKPLIERLNERILEKER